jgi:transcriptional regulator with XRE-family HTH domain
VDSKSTLWQGVAVKKQSDVLQRFGARVRQARKAHGLSQEAFADLCGLDRTYISGIECGNRNVALRNVEIIARALGLSVSELTRGI